MTRVRPGKMILIVLAAVMILLGGIHVSAMASTAAEEQRQYQSVQISGGDTLWSVAEEYCGSRDSRKIQSYVSDLREMNGIRDDGDLTPGSYLMVYKETAR